MSLTFTFVPIVEQHKRLELKEWGLEDFEDAIKTILRVTGESDLDKLVRNFIYSKFLLNINVAVEVLLFSEIKISCDIFPSVEEQNYTLLKFVNHQHNEAQTIERQISEVGVCVCSRERLQIKKKINT